MHLPAVFCDIDQPNLVHYIFHVSNQTYRNTKRWPLKSTYRNHGPKVCGCAAIVSVAFGTTWQYVAQWQEQNHALLFQFCTWMVGSCCSAILVILELDREVVLKKIKVLGTCLIFIDSRTPGPEYIP